MAAGPGTLTAGLKVLDRDNKDFQISIQYNASQVARKSKFILDEDGVKNAKCSVLGTPFYHFGDTYTVTSDGAQIACTKGDVKKSASVIIVPAGLAFARPKPPSFTVLERPETRKEPPLIVKNIDWRAWRTDGAGKSLVCLPPGGTEKPLTCDWSGDGTHTGCWERPDRMIAMCQARYGHAIATRGDKTTTIMHEWKTSKVPNKNEIQCEVKRYGIGDFKTIMKAPGYTRVEKSTTAIVAACILANPIQMESNDLL